MDELESTMASLSTGLFESTGPPPVDKTCNRVFYFESLNMSEYLYPMERLTLWQVIEEEWFKVLLCFLISIFAIIGNILVIMIIAVNKPMRIATNFYLLNMAITNLLIAGFCIWAHLLRNLDHSSSIYGVHLCKADPFIQMTTLTAGVLTLTSISCDRFVAVMFPMRARLTRRNVGFVISAIWIISSIISTPFLIFKKHHIIQWQDYETVECGETWPINAYFDEHSQTCIYDHLSKRVYQTVCSTALFFLPITVMTVTYVTLVRKLWFSRVFGDELPSSHSVQERSKRKFHSTNHEIEEALFDRDKTVVKMVIMYLIFFVICWLPLQVLILYANFGHPLNEQLPEWFSSTKFYVYLLAYFNGVINPVIYCGFNANYRQGMMRLPRFWKSKKTRVVNGSCQSGGPFSPHDSTQRTKVTVPTGNRYSLLKSQMLDVIELQHMYNEGHCRSEKMSLK